MTADGFEVIPPKPPLTINNEKLLLHLEEPAPSSVVDTTIGHQAFAPPHHRPMVGIGGGISPAATLRLHALILERDRLRISQENCYSRSSGGGRRDVEENGNEESGFLADSHYTPFLLYNNPQIPNNNLASLGLGPPSVDELTRTAVALRNAGADVVGFACTTAYTWKDQVSHAAKIPVLDLLDCTALRVQREGHKRVGLLDVDGTHKSGAFRNSLEIHGLHVLLPTPTEQQKLMKAVAEIKAGRITASDGNDDDGPVQSLSTICHRMANREDISAIILGCTEIATALGGASGVASSSSYSLSSFSVSNDDNQNDLPSGIQFFDCLEILAEEVILPTATTTTTTTTEYFSCGDERELMPLSQYGRGLSVDIVHPTTILS